jgi:hypothetical protein
MLDSGGAFLGLTLCVFTMVVLLVGIYWAVRLAIRDALSDRDRRRS